MPTLHRSKRIVVCLSLISIVLLATSCAPAATLTPTPPLTATPTSKPVATPTPTTAPLHTPTITEPPATTPEEVPRISIEEVKRLIDSGADIVIVDDRPKSAYEMGHIKGAIVLPWAMEITPADTQQLPRDKLIITYCDCGPGEADSADVALQLIKMGFRNVKTLAPGWSEWKTAGYPIEEGE